MRKTICYCDVCYKVYDEKQLDAEFLYNKEVCSVCKDKISSFIKEMTDKVSELTKPILNPEEITPTLSSTTTSSRKGPMSIEDMNTILEMREQGRTVEEMASKIGRPVSSIKRSLTCYDKGLDNVPIKHKQVNNPTKLDTRPDDMESTINKFRQPECSMVGTLKVEESAPKKPVDKPGILALANAGWTPSRIASEHNISTDEFLDILSAARKVSKK